MNLKQRILNLLIALDQFLFCCLCLGNSAPNETASAAAWRLEQTGQWGGRFFRPIIDTLFWFSDQHCKSAYEALMAGEHMPPRITGSSQ